VEKLLGRGKISGNKRLVGMCRELYGHKEWLWTLICTGKSGHGILLTRESKHEAEAI
jgi:hypothetical protein